MGIAHPTLAHPGPCNGQKPLAPEPHSTEHVAATNKQIWMAKVAVNGSVLRTFSATYIGLG